MRKVTEKLPVLVVFLALATTVSAADVPSWVGAMRDVHADSRGEKGVIVHFGDSITYSMAYFAPLQYTAEAKMSPSTREALGRVDGHINKDCYRWKGPEKGNYSGQTAAWGLENVDGWLATLKPEVVLIMFGTNDIRRGTLEAHEKNLRALIGKCLDNGVVVILSTIPPMHGFDEKVRRTVAVQRRIAAEMKVPLIDLHAHVLNRRPNDWDGSLAPFEGFSQWEVPTLISKDGVHPSNPRAWQSDYTEEGLARNGNVLRTYLALMAYAEVIDVVIHGREPSNIATTLLGANPPKPANLPKIDTPTVRRNPPPVQDWFPKAPPLPKPTGQVLRVANVKELYAAAENVTPGGTILLADGRYRMPLPPPRGRCRELLLGRDDRRPDRRERAAERHQGEFESRRRPRDDP